MASSSSRPPTFRSKRPTLEERWNVNKSALETFIKESVDTGEGNMTEALASASELRKTWRLMCPSETRPDWMSGEGRHFELEHALTTQIDELGRAIARSNKNASRSTVFRLMLTAFEGLRRKPEQCQREALNTLNQLDAHAQYKLDSLYPDRMDSNMTGSRDAPFRRGDGSKGHKRTRFAGASGMPHAGGHM